MRRREFITLLGGAAVSWPLAARVQQPADIPRIGFLRLGLPAPNAKRIEALRAGLRQLGYVEGKTIAIEFRWAETVDELPALAAELVRMNVDIILAPSSSEVEPARQATRTIPIVFASHADPIGVGHVASLPRPGGNITGLTLIQTDLIAKQLEILREVLPRAVRIGVLVGATAPSHRPAAQALETTGKTLGVELVMVSWRTVEDFVGAFSIMAQERVGGFVAMATPLTLSYRERLADLALQRRLPGIFLLKENAEGGGLMSYGADPHDLMRRAAIYIDKILRGAKPADLPVEQASKYELVINLKTAKALGLEVPPTLLARADEVIE
jgi:putative tryptophan/tyrosine transport system substrate-binding protein